MSPEPITKFWMVWNVDGNAPRYKHFSKALARDEAKRLAKLNPGNVFVVLAAVDAVVSPILEPQSVKLTKRIPDDDIPF